MLLPAAFILGICPAERITGPLVIGNTVNAPYSFCRIVNRPISQCGCVSDLWDRQAVLLVFIHFQEYMRLSGDFQGLYCTEISHFLLCHGFWDGYVRNGFYSFLFHGLHLLSQVVLPKELLGSAHAGDAKGAFTCIDVSLFQDFFVYRYLMAKTPQKQRGKSFF